MEVQICKCANLELIQRKIFVSGLRGVEHQKLGVYKREVPMYSC